MKKSLIIPTLLTFTIFTIYHYKIESKRDYETSNNLEKIEKNTLYADEEFYNTKKENFINEKRNFTVITAKEINTTRDNEIILSAKVQPKNSKEHYNFFWYEDDMLLGIGSTIKRDFERGEHLIKVVAKDGKANEANATTKVTAWEYKKIETLHFDVNYGELEYKELEIYDHKGHHLILDDGLYIKRSYTYNEEGDKIENSIIYYVYPTESRQWFYTYNEYHKPLTIKSINIETGETLYYSIKTYDEEGNITSSKSGQNEESLQDDSIDLYYKENFYDDNITEVENKNNKIVLNEDGLISYTEENYENMKIIQEYSYDSTGNITQQVSTTINHNNQYDIAIFNFNKNQDVVSYEEIYKTDEKVTCHHKTTSTYYKNGYLKTEKLETLNGICTYEAEDAFKKYTYDKDGRVENITLLGENESDTIQPILKVVKSYTNELDG